MNDDDLNMQPKCIQCGKIMIGAHIHKKYCSRKCKTAYYRTNPCPPVSNGHICRICGKWFQISKGQHNKWLCSIECIRASTAKSVREFHKRRPQMEAIYRARTKKKLPPDSMARRFYRTNPNAPRSCESCGETRVLEVAHKPGHERMGERRSSQNMRWPEFVWVLCPTCHRLLDRMNYSPQELGLL